MKFRLIIIAVLSFLLPGKMHAQLDTRDPGIYAIVRGESIPLKFSKSTFNTSSGGRIASSTLARYKGGPTSGLIADDTFVLVNDPEQWGYTASEPFLRSLTPDDMAIIPLTINPEKMRRECVVDATFYLAGMSVTFQEGGIGFEWTQISDNSFKIKVHGLKGGEYGIAFRVPGTGLFDYRYGVFGFTIPKGYLEGRITEMNTPIERGVQYYDIPPGKPKQARKDLREGGYNKPFWEIQWGYINKSWVSDYPSCRQREDLYGDGGRYMHGWNIGAVLTPSFDWGLGLRAGLFGETYGASKDRIRDYCSHYAELGLYVPLHATYRIPFKKDISLNLLAGPAFQWSISGSYEKLKGTDWTPGRRPEPALASPKKQAYGNGWPERTNWQAEMGFIFQFEKLGISFLYGFGLVDHHLQNSFDGGVNFETATRSRQDKMMAALSLYF